AFIESALQVGNRAWGSEFDFVRFLFSARGYYSPIPSIADLVLAGRLTVLAQSEGTPFLAMLMMPYTETSTTGLGGARTLRGYKAGRFVGPLMTGAQLEVRWTFFRFRALDQELALFICPFVDFGRVFDRVQD